MSELPDASDGIRSHEGRRLAPRFRARQVALALGAVLACSLVATGCGDGTSSAPAAQAAPTSSTDSTDAHHARATAPEPPTAAPGVGTDDTGEAKPSAVSDPRVVHAGESPTTLVGRDLAQCIATADQTGGGYSFLEIQIPAGSGPPPHEHPTEEEWFYLISGTASIQTGDIRTEVGPGDYFHVPRATAHSITAVTDVKLIAGYSPGGAETPLFCAAP